jgi:peptidoglycan/xylan/chitin deacetylase (PgdA/CDA1 family)
MHRTRLFLRVCALFILSALALTSLCGCEIGEYEELSTRKNYKNSSSPVTKPTGNTNNNANQGNQGNSNSNSSGAKRVALTFDDGPHNVRTIAIVDELARYGYRATFFVVGNRVDGTAYNGAEALKYAHDHGNEIAIHGYTHAVYYHNCDQDRYERELSNTYTAIKDAAKNANVRLMRPIGGNITDARVESCPYSVIMWSVDSEDWKYKGRGENGELAEQNINTIVENVMSQVKSGDIILMHDIYENTYEAAKIIIERLHAEGYQLVTVSELLGNAKPGVKYSRLGS